jgi:hypothetical protein
MNSLFHCIGPWMKFGCLSVFLVLSTSRTESTESTNAIGWTTFNCGSVNGTNYVQNISPRDADRLIRWNPESEPCPIDIRSAITAARYSLAALDKTLLGSRPTNILFEPLGESEVWLCRVMFALPLPGHGEAEPKNFSVVLSLQGWTPALRPTCSHLSATEAVTGRQSLVVIQMGNPGVGNPGRPAE